MSPVTAAALQALGMRRMKFPRANAHCGQVLRLDELVVGLAPELLEAVRHLQTRHVEVEVIVFAHPARVTYDARP